MLSFLCQHYFDQVAPGLVKDDTAMSFGRRAGQFVPRSPGSRVPMESMDIVQPVPRNSIILAHHFSLFLFDEYRPRPGLYEPLPSPHHHPPERSQNEG
ncbi:hypothetical protein E4U55_008104 [Claviceps digitariae]|nr:hypothetical protein E4U55_008104 [Claviceps digitariae]